MTKKCRSFFVVVSWALVVALATPSLRAATTGPNQVLLVFRCDDYSSTSDTEFEVRLIDLFRKHELPITLSVIPYVARGDVHDPSSGADQMTELLHPASQGGTLEPSARSDAVLALTTEKAAILKKAMADGVVELAQHGYSHQTRIARHWTEFQGMDYAEQRRRITAGRDLLDGLLDTKVHIFVPPWDRYDANTLRVLEEEGFDILSADCNDAADVSRPLAFVPATATLANVREAVQAALNGSERCPVVTVLFHNFEFQEAKNHQGNHTLSELDQLLGWAKSQPNLRVTTIADAANQTRQLSPDRLLAVHQFLAGVPPRLLPDQLASQFPILAYPVAEHDLQLMKVRLWCSFLVFWGVMFVVVSGFGYAVARLWHLPLLSGRWALFGTIAWTGICVASYLFTLASGRLFHAALLVICFCSVQLGGLIASSRRKSAPIGEMIGSRQGI